VPHQIKSFHRGGGAGPGEGRRRRPRHGINKEGVDKNWEGGKVEFIHSTATHGNDVRLRHFGFVWMGWMWVSLRWQLVSEKKVVGCRCFFPFPTVPTVPTEKGGKIIRIQTPFGFGF
jgi:hypothetical protein